MRGWRRSASSCGRECSFRRAVRSSQLAVGGRQFFLRTANCELSRLDRLAVTRAAALPAVDVGGVVAGAAVDAVALAAAEGVDGVVARRRRTPGPCRCPGAARRCRDRRRCGRAPGRPRCGRCRRRPTSWSRAAVAEDRVVAGPAEDVSRPREPGMWSPQITSSPPWPRTVSRPTRRAGCRSGRCPRSVSRPATADRLGAAAGIERRRRLARRHYLAVAEARRARVAPVDVDGVVAGAAVDHAPRTAAGTARRR